MQLPKYTLQLYNRPSAPLELKIRMLRAEVPKTMLNGCVLRASYYDTLPQAQHSFLILSIGWRNSNRTDHPILYLDTLIRTGSESIETLCAGGGSCSQGAWRTHETAEVGDVRKIFGGGRGLRGVGTSSPEGRSTVLGKMMYGIVLY